MTTIDRLAAIRALCVELLEGHCITNCHSCAGAAEAGWRATVATIDFILPYMDEDFAHFAMGRIAAEIISAWEATK